MVGAGGAVYWAFADLDQVASADQSKKSTGIATAPIDVESANIETTDVAMRSLRGPLYDPPAPPTRPAVTPPPPPPRTVKPAAAPPLALTLVGTIIDSQGRVAIFSDASGKFDIKSAGDTLELTPDGVTIETIESDAVTLNFQGRQTTVRLVREATQGPSGTPNARGSQRRRNQ
ncbi:hypothetical protein Poly51_12080 [Rubripirellula tenax]|uniref:Type II secretion system protein GspC N-terminal domain-containing protein n=2 Tax=Rubripirellula tenax TaxID=2528015 RepID=A0A5C6FCT0_9BACT|nr:hypothetical protein Poly51_12080 [Rubripirellula tenax]